MKKSKERFHVIILVLLLTSGLNIFCQKYDFVNYTIEQGLIQSQVNDLCIDNKGFLWIGTNGGISKFDGANFYNLNFSKGLARSFSSLVFCDLAGRIWINSGVSMQYIEKGGIHTFVLDSLYPMERIIDIKQSEDSVLYLLSSRMRLFQIQKGVRSLISGNLRVTAIGLDKNLLLASIYKKGIHEYDVSGWRIVIPLADTNFVARKIIKDRFDDQLFLIGINKIYTVKDQKMEVLKLPYDGNIYSFLQYGPDDFYLGTDKGAYHLENKSSEFLGSQKGLTDNTIYKIISDKEGHIWFATDGNGIYRYKPNNIKLYDLSTGLNGNLIMGLARYENGTIYAGNLELGLNKIENNKVSALDRVFPFSRVTKANTLELDKYQNLWIGSIGDGLLKYDGKSLIKIEPENKQFPYNIISLQSTASGDLWVGSQRGLHKINSKNEVKQIKSVNGVVFSTMLFNADTLLIGTGNGLRILNVHTDSAQFISNEKFNDFSVNKLIKFKDYAVIGTSENGVLIWDLRKNRIESCNETNGLSSNMVFSLLADEDCIYAGTVNGLNKIMYDTVTLQWKAVAIRIGHDKLGPECNQNALLKDSLGYIWVGTTKGIYVINPKSINFEKANPGLYLKSINVLSRSGDSSFLALPSKLKHHQNHITFHLQGIHLSAPEDIRYQYFLKGIDKDFSSPVSYSSFIFPQLNPGQYTFNVKTILASNPEKQSSIQSYAFYISPPFYQTPWFRFVAIFSLILFGAATMRYRLYLNSKRNKLVEAVRKQEQIKIQQRTSEDLHDDLGNKITRLALLTDILQTKISPDEDQQKIVNQIRDNIDGLYTGTKDIIWALSPHNHMLYDTLVRVRSFSTEMFQGSPILLYFDDIPDEYKKYKLPFEFSRNLIMICKESLHNVLRHSKASAVYIHAGVNDKDGPKLVLKIRDNGIGFDIKSIKKGNGLDNLQKRANRIGSVLMINSQKDAGTELELEVKIPLTEI